ncbi:MAG: beta-galactosidase [Anaerolineae bacterium]|nr:beta-galactosidase [Anaerolineae bacterium]
MGFWKLNNWLLRLGLAVLILVLLAAAPSIPPQNTYNRLQKVSLGSPRTVQTADPRVCVHTRLTDEVQEQPIQKTFEMVREMGAATAVEYFPWAYVEREEGVYDWWFSDRIIRHAENQGIRLIARLGFTPDWARPQNANGNYMNDRLAEKYAVFVGAFAERYAGRVDHLIIWNEPNLNIEWNGEPADPLRYTRLLQLAYAAAHAANPDVVILGGALAPTNEPPNGAGGWNDIDFLNELYEAGAGDYFDALAAHVYGFTSPPQAAPASEKLNFRRVELLREVMVKHGDENKVIFVTEGGWNDHPRWQYAVRPGQRITYTLDAYAYAAEHYPWLETFCLWAFRYPLPTNGYPDYFTYVSVLFDPRPIYTVLQAYAHGWDMPAWYN